MGYIDRPVDWLQYTLKIRPYTKFLIKLWRFENWDCATENDATVIDSAEITFLWDMVME